MSSRQSRRERGRRRGTLLRQRILDEVRSARTGANLSMRAVGLDLGWSESQYRRFEIGLSSTSFEDVAMVASILGMELGAGLHPVGDGLVDRGHQALLKRFRALVAQSVRVGAEIRLMNGGGRSWDLLLRIGRQQVGVEAETRVRDAQALVRRVRGRQHDGGADAILIVLSDSRHNRALAAELREMLGSEFQTEPRRLFAALREGRVLPGSGVLLV